MKHILSLLLFILFSFSSLEAVEKLILHFDINRTILSNDVATGKTTDDILLQALTEKYQDRWDESLCEPIPYSEYIKLRFPGSGAQAKTDRALQSSAFIEYLRENNHPYLRAVETEFHTLRNKIKKNGDIFSSFYKLIDYLDKEKIDYSIILRTFGIDVDKVVRMVNHKMSTQFFSSKGKYHKGSLRLENGRCITEIDQIYAIFKNSSHLAIQDDWFEWDSHQMHRHYSKRFPVDLEDLGTVSMFFDDNILLDPHSEKNIVGPIDVKTGLPAEMGPLLENQHLVPVDTLEAIYDDDYFIKKVKAAIASGN